MGTLKEYKCNGCGYTITGTRKGRTVVMSGEIETTKVPKKCPKCGGDMNCNKKNEYGYRYLAFDANTCPLMGASRPHTPRCFQVLDFLT